MGIGKYIKNSLIVILSLGSAFGLSLLFQYVFDVQEHITTVFVFAVFLISLFTEGYFYGVFAAFLGTVAVNYAFTFPYFSLNYTIPVNLISGIIMIAIAVLTGALTTKLKEHEATKAESEKERMRANLLRAVSHDLRTPLTTIYGSSTTLLENSAVLTEAQKVKIVTGIKEDSEWLVRMVENLLSVTRIDSGQVKILKSPTVLEELIDSVILCWYVFFCNFWCSPNVKDTTFYSLARKSNFTMLENCDKILLISWNPNSKELLSMPGYPAFDGFDDYEPQTIIIVYKDEMLLNQVKKLIEGKTIGDSGSHIKIVSWTEKVWLAQKKDGTIANKVLFLGDIKGTSALIPVVDTKFNKHGVRYGWAGKQAVLYAEPKEIKRFEDYESFWLEINGMPIPEIVKSGNKPKNPDADVAQKDTPAEEKETAPADSKKKNVFLKAKDFAVRKADALGKNVQKVATAASKASQDVFRNKSLVKRQMLFYGAVKLCESDLDDFMLS